VGKDDRISFSHGLHGLGHHSPAGHSVGAARPELAIQNEQRGTLSSHELQRVDDLGSVLLFLNLLMMNHCSMTWAA
jgi:hypothetical protein